MEILPYAVIGLLVLVCLGLGFLAMRFYSQYSLLKTQQNMSPEEAQRLHNQSTSLEAKLSAAQENLEKLQQQLSEKEQLLTDTTNHAQQQAVELTGKIATLQTANQNLNNNQIELQSKFKDISTKHDALQQELNTSLQDKTKLASEVESLNKLRQADEERFTQTKQELETSFAKRKQELEEHFAQSKQELEERIQASHQQQNELKDVIKDMTKKQESLQEQLSTAQQDKTKLASELESLNKLRKADEERFLQSQKELESRLQNLGEKLLKERSEALDEQNNKSLKATLNPLQTAINDFKKQISDVQLHHSQQVGSLQNELARLHSAQLTLTKQADELANALRQGGKSQGMWGEHQLELVLENAGLIQGTSYLREVKVTAQNDEDDGAGSKDGIRSRRIDAWIKLPNHKGILIDAKCSLTDYTDWVNAEMEADDALESVTVMDNPASTKDSTKISLQASIQNAIQDSTKASTQITNTNTIEGPPTNSSALRQEDNKNAEQNNNAEENEKAANTNTETSVYVAKATRSTKELKQLQQRREEALKRHIASVRKHINELAEKKYQDYPEYGSPSFVFMFVPIDNALSIALRADNKLFEYAQKNEVYLVSPSSLLPALRVVSELWILSEQNQKIQDLAEAANRIYNKSQTIAGYIDAVLNTRDQLNKNLDKLENSFSRGKGNLLNLLNNFSQKCPQVEKSFKSDSLTPVNGSPLMLSQYPDEGNTALLSQGVSNTETLANDTVTENVAKANQSEKIEVTSTADKV